MSLFSYHLVKLPLTTAIHGLFSPFVKTGTRGLIHAEYMTVMTLGSPIISASRLLIRQVALFAQWEDTISLEEYLERDRFGKMLASGWHIRMEFIRQWGKFSKFKLPDIRENADHNSDSPVVAVTIARMKPLEVPRFIHCGRPVEKLVRDHPGTTLALASYNFPNTVSTFSIWKSGKEMSDMVYGHSAIPKPKRHIDAMKERERKDFHFEFTTLRFKPIAEFGSWKGKESFIPNS